MKKQKIIFLAIFIFIISIAILKYSKACSSGISMGLTFCSEILIPSLFPFMALSTFIVTSGVSSAIGKKIEPLTKVLFNLPGSAGATIFISLIGGYPAGAYGIKSLLQNNSITKNQAERMSYFCIGAGPAFIITFIGVGIFSSFYIGVFLFISQVISTIIIGIVQKFIFNSKSKVEQNKSQDNSTSISNALVLACKESTNGMINMCAFVLLFSAFMSVLTSSGISETFSKFLISLGAPYALSLSLLPSLLEVTNATLIASKYSASPILFAFILSFSGLCVHFQVFSALRKIKINKLVFIIFRIFHAGLSMIITYLLFEFFPETVPVSISTNHSNFTYGLSNNVFSLISLLFLCLLFLFSINLAGNKTTQSLNLKRYRKANPYK